MPNENVVRVEVEFDREDEFEPLRLRALGMRMEVRDFIGVAVNHYLQHLEEEDLRKAQEEEARLAQEEEASDD